MKYFTLHPICAFAGYFHKLLEAHKLRLLFFADLVLRELRRMVEFLNLQMSCVEVLALELRQRMVCAPSYPHFSGKQKRIGAQKQVTYPSLESEELPVELARTSKPEEIHSRRPDSGLNAKLFAERGFRAGQYGGIVTTYFQNYSSRFPPVIVRTTRRISFNLGDCNKPHLNEEKLKEWVRRLNEIEGINSPAGPLNRWPSVSLVTVAVGDRFQHLISVLDWF